MKVHVTNFNFDARADKILAEFHLLESLVIPDSSYVSIIKFVVFLPQIIILYSIISY
jgi:hypothetical protein